MLLRLPSGTGASRFRCWSGPGGGDVRTHSYRITIAGGLGEIGREAFGDFQIETDGGDTVLTGYLDQAALYGTLNRILSLGFELVELRRLPDQTTPGA